MITIFNRKELICTFDMKEQSEIRNALEQNGIKYEVKAINRRSPSPLSRGTRASTGTAGENPSAGIEYIIYVTASDFEDAKIAAGI